MKFSSQTGQDVHISLTSGHTAVVTTSSSELEPRFHKEAVARGCLPEGISNDVAVLNTAETRAQVLKRVLLEMVKSEDPENFTAAGLPKMKQVEIKAGFKPERSEVEQIWAEVSAELDAQQ